MNPYDNLCIKSDVCDMAVCDGVFNCQHAVQKAAVLAQQTTNNARDESCPHLDNVGGCRRSVGHVKCTCMVKGKLSPPVA